jgi:hypothetical protein
MSLVVAEMHFQRITVALRFVLNANLRNERAERSGAGIDRFAAGYAKVHAIVLLFLVHGNGIAGTAGKRQRAQPVERGHEIVRARQREVALCGSATVCGRLTDVGERPRCARTLANRLFDVKRLTGRRIDVGRVVVVYCKQGRAHDAVCFNVRGHLDAFAAEECPARSHEKLHVRGGDEVGKGNVVGQPFADAIRLRRERLVSLGLSLLSGNR